MALSSAIGGGLALGMFMAISVGPTLFAVIKYSLNHSYKAGLFFVLGVSISDVMYVTLANLAAPFLEYLHHYKDRLAYGGGAILIAIGLMGLIKKYKPKRPSSKLTSISNSQYFRIAGSGFLINTVNPGVVLNWLAAVTLIADKNSVYRIVFLSSCLVLVLGIDCLKVVLADAIRKKLTLRLVMYLQKLSSLILLLFGVVIIAITFFNVDIGLGE